MHLYEQLRLSAERHQDKPALYFSETVINYSSLLDRVHQATRALQARGIVAGDSVALLVPNCPDFIVTYYACARLGALCVPANPLLKPAELTYMWGDSKVKLVVTAGPLLPGVLEAKADLPDLNTIWILGADDMPGAHSFEKALAAEPAEDLGLALVDETTAAVCIYTSGTTGRPKGALLSHRNLTINCEQISQVLDFGQDDNFLCVLPLFHSFAGTVCQNAALKAGASVTLLDQFHPAKVAESIGKHGVTIFPAVPAMYGAMLQLPSAFDSAFSKVRLCVSGGAPMPVALMQAFETRFNTIIIEGDGPTECSPVTSVNPPVGVRKPGTIGIPLPGVEMKIFDDEDREVPTGQVGEIVVRGESVMLGYLNQPEETAAAMKSGWYHTGDLGLVDDDGYFSIVDRKKDMLLVGGLNVYPREVEEVLYSHPAVQDAAVIGMPDKLKGEQVLVIVALKPGAEATDRDLIHYCRERLANYKCPRKVQFRDALPRGSTGKVLKRLLRKEFDLEA